jgi:hypothetical protein
MGSAALVGFRLLTTISLEEMPFYLKNGFQFLAYQMPECQAGLFFQRFGIGGGLTISALAYQMP